MVLTHEMAHDFRCPHDHAAAGATDGEGVFRYGHRHDYGGQTAGDLVSYVGGAGLSA